MLFSSRLLAPKFFLLILCSSANAQQADIETLQLMLRALLVERFQMKTHMEDRQVSAYNLVAAKPKLTKADPSNRANCKEGSSLGGKDPRDTNPVLSRLVTCQNTTMAQFADRLQALAPGPLGHKELLRWGVYDAPKAEGREFGKLPGQERIEQFGFKNLWAVWPTKLTLAPTARAAIIAFASDGSRGAQATVFDGFGEKLDARLDALVVDR